MFHLSGFTCAEAVREMEGLDVNTRCRIYTSCEIILWGKVIT